MIEILTITRSSITMALVSARSNGLPLGSVVAYIMDSCTYILSEIRGEKAILKIPAQHSSTGEEIVKEVLLWDIYDPHLALALTVRAASRRRVPR